MQSSLCNRGICLVCVCTLAPFSRLTHYRFQNECVHNVSVSSCCMAYQPLNVWLWRDETHYWFRFQAASKSVRLPRLVMSFEDCMPDWAQLPKWHRHAGDKKGPGGRKSVASSPAGRLYSFSYSILFIQVSNSISALMRGVICNRDTHPVIPFLAYSRTYCIKHDGTSERQWHSLDFGKAQVLNYCWPFSVTTKKPRSGHRNHHGEWSNFFMRKSCHNWWCPLTFSSLQPQTIVCKCEFGKPQIISFWKFGETTCDLVYYDTW